jgi:phosphoribosyl 1,2-cyclic phosphodiesterase
VEEDGLAVLIDNGLSLAELTRRLKKRDLDPKRLVGVFVTHEHTDHIGGVGPLSRGHELPVYTSPLTFHACGRTVGNVDFCPFASGEKLKLGSLTITAVSSSHDAADPQLYVVRGNTGSLGVATDLGVVTHLVRQSFLSLTAIVSEFNHDLKMLADGPYPWFLKQRVRGRKGHLSNDEAAQFLIDVNHEGLSRVVLGHLSEVNNKPELAFEAAAAALSRGPGNPGLTVASQWEPTEVFEI